MMIAYLGADGQIVDVREASPLPVQVANAKLVSTDTLLVVTTTVTTDTNRDLLGSTDIETRTLANCGQYRKLIWFYFREGDADTTYRILARVTDQIGAPLGTGWQTLVSNTLLGGANTWGRIDIPVSPLGEAYYDQYRIEIWRTSGEDYTLRSKLIGVR